MRVGMNYYINNAQFEFPHGGRRGGEVNPGDTRTFNTSLYPIERKTYQHSPFPYLLVLKLTAQPSRKAIGKVEAHLIPSLNLGISTFSGVVEAGVFVDLDASTSVTLTVESTGDEKDHILSPQPSELPALPAGDGTENVGEGESGVITPRGLVGSRHFTRRSPSPQPFSFEDMIDGMKDFAGKVNDGMKAVGTGIKEAAGKVAEKFTGGGKPAPTATTESPGPKETGKIDIGIPPPPKNAIFGGCLELDAGFGINVGASANFFGLFSPSTKLSLFSKEFPLYKVSISTPFSL